jgi:CDGSH-type Zn-finger protein
MSTDLDRGHEGRQHGEPVARIGVYPDGPLLVRGPVELVDEHGVTIVVRRKTFALCRCGRTRTAPLCDGTHASAGFRAPADARCEPPARAPSVSV